MKRAMAISFMFGLALGLAVLVSGPVMAASQIIANAAADQFLRITGAPSTLFDGRVWYDDGLNQFQFRENGVTKGLGAGGGGTHPVDLDSDVTGTLAGANLDNTAVTPASYTATDLTVDAQGRITAAANGTVEIPGETSTTFTAAHIPFSNGSNLTSENGLKYDTTNNTAQVVDESGTQHADYEARAFGGGFGGRLIGVSCRGTEASPTATLNTDVLVDVVARGCDGPGSFTANTSFFRMEAGETWSGSAHGTRGRFFGVDDGTTIFDTVVDMVGGTGVGSSTTFHSETIDVRTEMDNGGSSPCASMGAVTNGYLCAKDTDGFAVAGRAQVQNFAGLVGGLNCVAANCGGTYQPSEFMLRVNCTAGTPCTLTLGETNALDGDLFLIVADQAVGVNDVTVVDQPGVVELEEDVKWSGRAGQMLALLYSDSSGGQWVEAWRSNALIPATLASFYVNAAVTAVTYGGGVMPSRRFGVSALKFRVAATGSGGTTNVTFRVSDGSNNCDGTLACNTTANTNYRVAMSGSCDFDKDADLTYSINAVGDCSPQFTVLGNVDIEGHWQ